MAGHDTHSSEEADTEFTTSEETPLLTASGSSTTADEQDPREKYRTQVLVLSFLAIFLIEISVGVCTPAWAALIEKGLCSEMNPDIADHLVLGENNPFCKSPEVQGKLALIRGWNYTIELIPTLFFAIPFGAMSDSWGRKPVLLLSFFGVFLTTVWYEVVLFFGWPVWSVLLAGMFNTIGGGSPVGVSMFYTMLADVVHVEDMASTLFRFVSVFLIAELVASPLCGFLLSFNPWVPLIFGNVFFILCMVGITFLPETLVIRRWHDERSGHGASQPDLSADVEGLDAVKKSIFQKAIGVAQANFKGVWDFVLGNKHIVLLMLPQLFVALGKYVSELLLQYSTKRYGWSWSKAAYFMSFKSGSFVLFLAVLLPAASSFCQNVLKMSPLSKDLWLSRWCGVALVVADLLVAFSFTPWIFTVGLVIMAGGAGFNVTLRSVLNALVEPHHVGMLNTLMGLMETIALMVAAPVFAEALRTGINLGGPWMGLPFMCAALISSIACFVIFSFHVPEAT